MIEEDTNSKEHNNRKYLEANIVEYDVSLTGETVDLFINVFSQSPWFDIFDSRDEVVGFFNAFINMPNFQGYQLLDSSGKVIGISIGFLKPWLKDGHLRYEYFLDQFCIDVQLQGMGYGKYFMNSIENDLRKKGIGDIILNTDISSPSFHFYTKTGFVSLNEFRFLSKEI